MSIGTFIRLNNFNEKDIRALNESLRLMHGYKNGGSFKKLSIKMSNNIVAVFRCEGDGSEIDIQHN
jgi:hypothetical protein